MSPLHCDTQNRQQVEGLLDENPKFRALDKAIAKEGFKVILLLRLSPIFPFALSNYLYGVTSVDFVEYMMGTLIGFFPGTLAYVYGGTVSLLLLLPLSWSSLSLSLPLLVCAVILVSLSVSLSVLVLIGHGR